MLKTSMGMSEYRRNSMFTPSHRDDEAVQYPLMHCPGLGMAPTMHPSRRRCESLSARGGALLQKLVARPDRLIERGVEVRSPQDPGSPLPRVGGGQPTSDVLKGCCEI